MKRWICLLLALLLLGSVCACGKKDPNAFRTLRLVGTKQYSVLCRGGDRLAPVIDAAMATMAENGTLGAIITRWLGNDRCCYDTKNAVTLAELDEESLPEPRLLLIGVDSDAYPLAYTDAYGGADGLCVDIARALGETLGWDIRLISITPDSVAAQLSSGNVDCALGFDASIVDSEKYSAGGSFLESEILLAVRNGSDVRRLRDLKGTRVGTVNDPAVLRALKGNEKVTKYAAGATEYLSLPRCIEALDAGWCSAVVLDELMLRFYRQNDK